MQCFMKRRRQTTCLHNVTDMQKRNGITVAGSILVDKIYTISAYPNSGELTQIRSITQAVGGLVPNNGIGLKKLFPSLPVFAIGKIGNDELGAYVLGELQRNGVDTSGVRIVEDETTSFTDVMSVAGGQRTFFTYPGGSADFGYDDIDWSTVTCKMLHLGYFLLLDKIDKGDGLRILKEAKSRGIKTSIDLVSENSDRYSVVLPCLPYVDNLIINELEAGKLCGIEPTEQNLSMLATKLLDMGVRERVIIHTLSQGLCASASGCTTLPSYCLPEGFIQGTTGAGDAFCSGALIGIYQEKSDREILEYAQIAAIASLRSTDATGGLDDFEGLYSTFENFERE